MSHDSVTRKKKIQAAETSAVDSAPMPEFGVRLKELLDAKNLSIREFSRQTKAAGAYASPTTLSEIIGGERTPNPANAAWWGHMLGLDGRPLTEFIELARMARLKGKSDSVDWVEVMERREKMMTDRLKGAAALLRALLDAAQLGHRPTRQLVEAVAQFEKDVASFQES